MGIKFLTFLLFACIGAQAQVGIFKPYVAPYKNTFPLAIEFMGQSNAGKISAQSLLPANLQEDIPTNFEYYSGDNAFRILSANGPKNSPYPGPFHIERNLFKLLSNYYSGNKLYFIQNSFSATSINTWQPPAGATYLSSVTYHNNAISHLPVPNPPLRVIVWLQGEADCGDPTTYNNYGPLLTNLINQKRTDYGDANLRFILVSLSSGQTTLNTTGRNTINSAMQSLAGSLTNVYYISQNEPTQDGVHYSPTGAGNIAQAIFDLFITLQFP
jgi:hypothetical protein